MAEDVTHAVVELIPIPPDTVQSIQREVENYIKEGLAESGKSELLKNNEISLSVEETFPTAEAVHVLFTIGGGVALEVFKQVVLPWLKAKYETRFKSENKEGGTDEVKQ